MNFVTFDIETYHPDRLDEMDTSKFRVSVVGAYFSWLDEYIAFLEDDVSEFLRLLKEADLVVGYNHIWFDLPVLQKYANFDLQTLPNYDILLEIEKRIGYKVKLNDICKANLGESKTDSFEQFKNYYWDKNWLPLIDYCMHDVRLTNQIFEQIRQTGKLKYPDMHEIKEIEMGKPEPYKRQSNQTEAEGIF